MPIWLAFVAAGLAGCEVGVNDDLVATSTPYPIRSPVAAGATPDVASPPADVASLVAAGEAALAAGDLVAAERAFDRALIRAPSDPAALLGRAETRLGRGDLAGARSDAMTLSRAAVSETDLLLARSQLMVRFREGERAIADFGEVLSREPGNVQAFIGRANAVLGTAQGDDEAYEQALADFRRALTLDPSASEAQLGPALVFIDRAEFGGDPADWDRAGEELAAVADQLGLADPHVAAGLARVQLALGDPETALGTVAAALRDDVDGPRLSRLHAVEAAIALAQGDWSTALAAAEAGIAADPLGWEARYARIQALLGAGRVEAAIGAVDELVALLPGDGRALYLQGLALHEGGDHEGARSALEAAMAALPRSAVYQARIATALGLLDSTPTASPPATATPFFRLREIERGTPAAGVVRLNRLRIEGAAGAAMAPGRG